MKACMIEYDILILNLTCAQFEKSTDVGDSIQVNSIVQKFNDSITVKVMTNSCNVCLK